MRGSWLAAALIVGLALGAVAFDNRLSSLELAVNILSEEMRPMHFEWWTSGPNGTKTKAVLDVPREPDWTIEFWMQAARDQLEAAQAAFPPVEPP